MTGATSNFALGRPGGLARSCSATAVAKALARAAKVVGVARLDHLLDLRRI